MEKMGWSKGKGLGAKEQGDVDHISVKFKDKEDVRGVGFEGHDATWIAHQVWINSRMLFLLNRKQVPYLRNFPVHRHCPMPTRFCWTLPCMFPLAGWQNHSCLSPQAITEVATFRKTFHRT